MPFLKIPLFFSLAVCMVAFAAQAPEPALEAQAPEIEWTHAYGEAGKSTTIYSMDRATDGGYILAGETHSSSDLQPHPLLIKIDSNGTMIWEKTLGEGENGQAYSVQQVSDGGYVLAGSMTTPESPLSPSIFLLKTDASGNAEWNGSYQLEGGSEARAVRQTSDGGYVLVANDRYLEGSGKLVIIKVKNNGTYEWERDLANGQGVKASSIEQASDGGFIISATVRTAKANGSSDYDTWVLKTDSTGKAQAGAIFTRWPFPDYGIYAYETPSGYRAASRMCGSGIYDCTSVWVVDLDRSGNMGSNPAFGSFQPDSSYAFANTSDGGYILAGERYSGTGVQMTKAYANGTVQWHAFIYSPARPYAALETSDGGYLIAGTVQARQIETSPSSYRLEYDGIAVKFSPGGQSPALETGNASPQAAADIVRYVDIDSPSAITVWVHDSSNQGVESWVSVNPPSTISGPIASPGKTDRNGVFKGTYNKTGRYTIVISPIGAVSGNLGADIRLAEPEAQQGTDAAEQGQNETKYGPVPELGPDLSGISIPDEIIYGLAGLSCLIILALGVIFYLALFSRRPPG